jgi:HD-GYP domain-containing protein (c-di-GMP phosphodiesterase class II)
MNSERAFRSALGEEVAVAELRAGAGTQFDGALVELFLGILAGVDVQALPAAS